jgi:hypothetical protein
VARSLKPLGGRCWLVLALLTPVLVLAAVGEPPQASGGKAYDGYISLFGSGPVHEGSQGAGWTASFRERRRGRVRYRVCLKHTNSPKVKRCWRGRTGRRGRSEIFVARFVNDRGGPGRWRATWRRHGRRVDAFEFKVRPEFG